MKYLLVLILGITLGYLLCNVMNPSDTGVTDPPTELSNGKYIEGTVIANGNSNQLGLIEFSSDSDHNNSYLALYQGSSSSHLDLFQAVYAKVKEENGYPVAYEIEVNKPETGVIPLPDNFITTLDYHSFTTHNRDAGLHKKVHYGGQALTPGSSAGIYELETTLSSGQTQMYYCNYPMKVLVESYGDGTIYLEADASLNVTQLDTCHRHGNRVIDCRQ